jgi:uncharacterized repeat protein (TIGR03803 family)
MNRFLRTRQNATDGISGTYREHDLSSAPLNQNHMKTPIPLAVRALRSVVPSSQLKPFGQLIVLGLMTTEVATAQNFTVLHAFTAISTNNAAGTNMDGAAPQAALALSGGKLVGTAAGGGAWGSGCVFALNTDGTGFTNLYSFAPMISGTNADGANPFAVLTVDGDVLFGTTAGGGESGNGTVFRINADGTGFSPIYTFMGTNDGASPWSPLTLSSHTLYGTAHLAGSANAGVVFKLNTDGSGFTVLHSFPPVASQPFGPFFTNSDGAHPYSGLLLSGNTLYGTAASGGAAGNGSIFSLRTDGSAFTNLHNFSATSHNSPGGTNLDGAGPYGRLMMLDGRLYGTARSGGAYHSGTVFSLATNGSQFVTLHTFNGVDGVFAHSKLVPLNGVLYGNTLSTLFAMNTNGSGFVTLFKFPELPPSTTTNAFGGFLWSSLVISGDRLYGTASAGGPSGYGTVFDLLLQPTLTIARSGANAVLNWPTNFGGYTLQSSTTLVSPAWTTNSTASVILNGQYTITNSISGAEQFFRLGR